MDDFGSSMLTCNNLARGLINSAVVEHGPRADMGRAWKRNEHGVIWSRKRWAFVALNPRIGGMVAIAPWTVWRPQDCTDSGRYSASVSPSGKHPEAGS
jgi:hypothetical protein